MSRTSISQVLRTGLSVRPLGRPHRDRVRGALADEPIAGCLVAERFAAADMDSRRLGGCFWGVNGGRDAVAFVGGNVIPLHGDPASLGQLAGVLARKPRTVASLVGSAHLVLPMWQSLEPSWGPAREVRANQPVLTCPDPARVAPDPQVQAVDPGAMDVYFPAAVAMFTEEVGVDPRQGDQDGEGYRRRVHELIRRGHAFARFVDGRVVFKAEIGAVSESVAMIQGVWVAPDFRGQGLAAPAMAAIVGYIHSRWRLLPVLYVNHHNTAARRAYHRVGFGQVGTFASVLF